MNQQNKIVERQHKRRYLYLLTKSQQGKTLSMSEIRELQDYEAASAMKKEIDARADAPSTPVEVSSTPVEDRHYEMNLIERSVPKRKDRRSPAGKEEKRLAAMLLALGRTSDQVGKALGRAAQTIRVWACDDEFKKEYLDPAVEQAGVAAKVYMLPRLNKFLDAVMDSVESELADLSPLEEVTTICPHTGHIIKRERVGTSISQKMSMIERIQKVAFLTLEKPTEIFKNEDGRGSSTEVEILVEAVRQAKLKDPLGALIAEQDSVKEMLRVVERVQSKSGG